VVKVKRVFLERNMLVAKIDEYLAKHFSRAGYAGVEVFRTPLGNRVVIYAERPAFFIGRRGQTIKHLSQIFETFFNLENPQITVMPVENPDLSARIVAFRLAQALEKGYHFRRAAFAALKRIMDAGAVGAEIVISGKLTSERARSEKFRAGKVYKTGHQASYIVDKAVAHALLKPGIYGVKVLIVKPERPVDSIEITPPDAAGLKPLPKEEVGEARQETAEETAEEIEAQTGGETP